MILSDKEFLKILKEITKTKDGIKFVSHLIDISGYSTGEYIGDSNRLAYVRGKEFLGMYLDNALKLHCIENYQNMLKLERNLYLKKQKEYNLNEEN